MAELIGGSGYDDVKATEPSNPSVGDTWLDTSTDPPTGKIYADLGSGGQWTTDLLDAKVSTRSSHSDPDPNGFIDSPISRAGGYDYVDRKSPSETPNGGLWAQTDYGLERWSHTLHTDRVTSVHSDGDIVVSGGRSTDDLVIAVDPVNATEDWRHTLHSGNVNDVHTDGDNVYSAGSNDEIIAAYAFDGSQNWSHSLNSDPHFVTSDDEKVYSGNFTVYAVSELDGSEVWSHSIHPGSAISGSTNGNILATGGDEKYVVVVDIADGSEIWSKEVHQGDLNTSQVYGVAVDQDDVFSCGADSRVVSSTLSDGTENWVHTLHSSNGIYDISVDEKYVYSIGVGGLLIAADKTDGTEVWRKSIHSSAGNGVYSRMNNIYTASDDGSVVSTSSEYITDEHVSDGSKWMIKE